MVENENERDADGDGEGILTPDELGVEDQDGVEEIEENRFLISTGDSPSRPAEPPEESVDTPAPETADDLRERAEREMTAEVSATPLGAVSERYAVQVAAKTDEGVAETRLASDSIVEVFELLLAWYGQQVDPTTPADEVIEILLAESRFSPDE